MDALGQLDRLRREAVERARLDVFEARAAQQQAEQVWQDAQRAAHAAERAQEQAQQAFSRASSVLDLRAAELLLLQTRTAITNTAARLTACEQARRNAAAQLRTHEQTLLEAELGRRAVERKLTQRAADVGRRAERDEEAEAEDAYRSAALTRTRTESNSR